MVTIVVTGVFLIVIMMILSIPGYLYLKLKGDYKEEPKSKGEDIYSDLK